MAAQYNAQNDLNIYLQNLERRMQALEWENQQLREAVQHNGAGSPQAIMQYLPQTGLLSQSFMTRAFTVWGHYFVAQLLISLGLFAIYLIIALVFGAVLSGVFNN